MNGAHSGMPAGRFENARWRKSSRSNPSGACVELAGLPGGRIAMRDSKNPGGPVLIVDRAGAEALLGRIRCGELG